jgi:hypothetical protein
VVFDPLPPFAEREPAAVPPAPIVIVKFPADTLRVSETNKPPAPPPPPKTFPPAPPPATLITSINPSVSAAKVPDELNV